MFNYKKKKYNHQHWTRWLYLAANRLVVRTIKTIAKNIRKKILRTCWFSDSVDAARNQNHMFLDSTWKCFSTLLFACDFFRDFFRDYSRTLLISRIEIASVHRWTLVFRFYSKFFLLDRKPGWDEHIFRVLIVFVGCTASTGTRRMFRTRIFYTCVCICMYICIALCIYCTRSARMSLFKGFGRAWSWTTLAINIAARTLVERVPPRIPRTELGARAIVEKNAESPRPPTGIHKVGGRGRYSYLNTHWKRTVLQPCRLSVAIVVRAE